MSDSLAAHYQVTADTFTNGGLHSLARQRAEVLEGMFVAPQTAWYSFYVTSHARCHLEIGTTHSFDGTMLTADCPSWNPTYDYLQYNYRTDTLSTGQTTAMVSEEIRFDVISCGLTGFRA